MSFEAKSSFPYSFETSCKTCGSSTPLFNDNLCVKTRAKPVTKTFQENFALNFPESARLSPPGEAKKCIR